MNFLSGVTDIFILVIGDYQGESLTGLEDLTNLARLELFGSNSMILSLEGLQNVNSDIDDLRIMDLPYLQSFEGLNNITGLTDIRIEDNSGLTDFCVIAEEILESSSQGSNLLVIDNNAYNPTISDFLDDNCSL